MKTLGRSGKRKQIIDFLRDTKNHGNTNAAIARYFDVTPGFIAKVRAEVEADGEAFLRGSYHDVTIDSLRLDGGTQPRTRLDKNISREYRDDIKAGAIFPPIGVVFDGTDYWVWDGFHRVEAHRLAGRETIQAEVRQGTRRDAVLLAAGANAGHGWRRTNEDKRRAVEHLLRDPEWVSWSNEEIARKCYVSSATVGNIRKELEDKGEIESKNFRLASNGHTRNVSAVGSRPSTNGHAARREPHDEQDGSEAEPAAEAPPEASQAAPLASEPVQAPTFAEVRVTLRGEPETDLARLMEFYPLPELERLGRLIVGQFKQCGPYKINGSHLAILERLRVGPATRQELVQMQGRAPGRIWEMNNSGYVIQERDGQFWLDREPSEATR